MSGCRFINQNVTMKRATSRQLIIPVTDENGQPFDLTNGNAAWWLGTSPAARTPPDVILKKDTQSIGGMQIVPPTPPGTLWSLSVFIQAADTRNAMPRSSYYHEASVVDRGFNVYVVAFGTFEILQSMTPDQFIT